MIIRFSTPNSTTNIYEKNINDFQDALLYFQQDRLCGSQQSKRFKHRKSLPEYSESQMTAENFH